ncbi:hypothetical protein WJ973_03180 [Achromobacter xylosoxidans]
MSEQMGAAAQSASKAWWDLLQQQFNQIAAATAASMPGSQPAPEADKSKAKPGGPQAAAAPAAKAAKTVAKPARKTAQTGRQGGHQEQRACRRQALIFSIPSRTAAWR